MLSLCCTCKLLSHCLSFFFNFKFIYCMLVQLSAYINAQLLFSTQTHLQYSVLVYLYKAYNIFYKFYFQFIWQLSYLCILWSCYPCADSLPTFPFCSSSPFLSHHIKQGPWIQAGNRNSSPEHSHAWGMISLLHRRCWLGGHNPHIYGQLWAMGSTFYFLKQFLSR